MPENLFSKGQRLMTAEGKANFDRIFKKKKKVFKPLPVDDNLVNQEQMERNGVSIWVHIPDVSEYEKNGWKRVA